MHVKSKFAIPVPFAFNNMNINTNTKSTGDFRMLQNNINKKKLNVLCYINKTYIVLNLYIHTSMFDFIISNKICFFLVHIGMLDQNVNTISR